jgi:hypothetical protein
VCAYERERTEFKNTGITHPETPGTHRASDRYRPMARVYILPSHSETKSSWSTHGSTHAKKHRPTGPCVSMHVYTDGYDQQRHTLYTHIPRGTDTYGHVDPYRCLYGQYKAVGMRGTHLHKERCIHVDPQTDILPRDRWVQMHALHYKLRCI